MPPVIRPYTPPILPNPPTRAPAASDVRAAQRAFFQQAVETPAAASTPSAVPVVARPTSQAIEPAVTRVKTQPIPEEKPTRYMRPGSFVDIKV